MVKKMAQKTEEQIQVEDYRQTNPRYHNLLVNYAMETQQTAYAAIEELMDHSRVDSALMAGALQQQIAENIKRSEAWREAAWRRAAHMPPPLVEELNEH